jgi:magnesium-transporting ATPase (P-type)
MDGIWTVSIACTLPLSRAAAKLAKSRPTASVLSPQTIASVVGILAINFLFLVGALFYLNDQDWYQCRKWGSTDVSNVLVIGDNYETEVLFLVGGFQYIHAGAAFNFGYEFRQAWCRNYFLTALIVGYTTMHLYVMFNPGELSCLWRVNCVNENVLKSVTSDEIPIQNDFNTTIMPDDFKRGLCGLMITNFVVVVAYEYFVVNGIRRHFSAKKRRDAKASEVEDTGGLEGEHSIVPTK